MLPEGDQRTETNVGDELRWGNFEDVTIMGEKWNDLNANGIDDAEPRLGG